MLRRFFVISAIAVTAGCEQETQPLPFDVDAVASGTVTAQSGGVVSNPGGASVTFPSGSVGGNVEVSVAPSTVPASMAASGVAASDAFRIEPQGTTLAQPAELEVKFAPTSDRGWLASIVGVSSGVVREHGATRVDLTTGIAATDIGRFGTFAVVIPEPAAVHHVQPLALRSEVPISSAVLPGQTTRTVSVDCGAPGDRCTGLTATASQNLLDQIEDAAAVYPTVSGQITITGSAASGQITASAPIRVFLQSGSTAEVLEFVATVTPTSSTIVTETASQIRMTNVRQRVTGGSESENGSVEEISTLIINKSNGNGTIVVDRQFDIRVSGGSTQSASVAVTVPVQLNP